MSDALRYLGFRSPITARDLGRSLEYTVGYGAIPLTWLREMLQFYDPARPACGGRVR